MDYTSVLDYLYAQLPMFHRVGVAAYKADLSNTFALMDMTEHPYRSFKSIHIAGTNGKGSTSHMLAAILQKAGFKVGLYTSPHLVDFRERIRVDGKMIPREEVVRFVDRYKEEFESIRPSFFEWTVALAFSFFKDQKVDIAVIETGLGGRLDSTNVITPEVSVITNIGWDHANLLGDTLQKIAGEKAGIIKNGVPVVIGERDATTEDVFISRASAQSSGIVFASDIFDIKTLVATPRYREVCVASKADGSHSNYRLALTGLYQKKNLATVLATVNVLRSQGWTIPDRSLHAGLQEVTELTGLGGRWQLLSEKPTVIADVAHNEHGIRELVRHLTEMRFEKLHIVTGMVRDKDFSSVLSLLPKDASYHFCQPDLPRALPVSELYGAAESEGLTGDCHQSVVEAIESAVAYAGKNDIVLITGSTFVVAEALPLFKAG